jgi:hypothetical protein
VWVDESTREMKEEDEIRMEKQSINSEKNKIYLSENVYD